MPMCAAASAVRSASSTRTFPTPWSVGKTDDIVATGASTLLAGDLGCLMNMAGKLQREGKAVIGAPRGRSAGGHDRHGADRRGTRTMTS